MIVDILVLAVLFISALIAFFRGFIREVLTIAAVVGGVAAAYFGGPLLSPVMRGWLGVKVPPEAGAEVQQLFGVLPYDTVADALSYGAVFIVVVIALSVLSHFMAEAARSIGLGAIDRTLGFIFGLARGVLLLGILYLPILFFIDQDSKAAWFSGSKTHFYLEKVSQGIARYIPNSAVDDVQGKIDKVEEADKTRQQLEKIDLLKSKDAKPQPQDTKGDAQGYDDEFRGQMNELFEEKTAPASPSSEEMLENQGSRPRKMNE